LCNLGRLFHAFLPFAGIEQPFAFMETVAEPNLMHNRVIFRKDRAFSLHAPRIPGQ